MGLKARLASLDDVAEAVKSLYKEVDGAFVIDVDATDGWDLQDVSGLKSALNKERSAAGDAKSLLDAYKGDDGEYLDPSAGRDAIAKVIEFAKIDPKKEAGKLAEEQVTLAKAAINADWQTKFDVLNAREGKLKGVITKSLVDQAILTALTDKEVRGNPAVLAPLMKQNVIVVEGTDDDGNPKFSAQVRGDDGHPKLNGAGDPMSIKEYALDLRKDESFSMLFEADSKTGGGGKPAGKGPKTPSNSGELHGRDRIRAGIEELQS